VSQKPDILIHTALFSEAKPIISHFRLRQYETKPFKIFRGALTGGGRITLIVSGVGRDNTREALTFIYETPSRRKMFTKALNIGTAGCNDKKIAVGSLFLSHGFLKGIPNLNLQTFDTPVTHLELKASCLVDMEASYFLEISESFIPEGQLYVLKVVSDYLEDSILGKKDIHRLIADTLPFWESLIDDYPDKMESVINQNPFGNLNPVDQDIIRNLSLEYRFSHQELKQLIEMALDFKMWDEPGVDKYLNHDFPSGKEAYTAVKLKWEELKNTPKSYAGFSGNSDLTETGGKSLVDISRDTPGFGRCPVASERTRCCNLLTLDAVEGCGFDCSYCSIRYFYSGESIGIDEGFIEKLKLLEIDPDKSYHIGTGQSSDSLMWGNKAGILDALLDFAGDHPNVILELKTKSDNISHLMSREIPVNVLTTWSLNPQVIIENEEHFTASLEQRLVAAERIAGKGNLVGFHFHPMVYYDEWNKDYKKLFQQLIKRFKSGDVALVSLGTLTFIKPVIKKMRGRQIKSKILQMPLEDAEGKYSYPIDIKKEMFLHAYNELSEWHNRVFFYMCMEDVRLWKDVFGFEYQDNDAFEVGMIESYEEKIREKRNSHR